MGIVNLYKGLNSDKEIYNFNGKIKDNLSLNWEYTKILKNNKELTSDYEVQENDVLIIQEYPAGLTTLAVTAIVLGVVTLGVGIGVGIYAYQQAEKVRKEMEEASKRVGRNNNQKDVSSIPQLGDAKNERADGKNAPIILGRHLFAPYFLSEPYIKPSGADGEDLYWYGTFLAGQNGLCFEKIRNGNINLVTFSENIPQKRKYYFDKPSNYNPKDPPPFYDPENYIEIAQKGYNEPINKFSDSVFEEKWVDSLDSSVEIGRKKKENAKTVNNIYMDDDGIDPVIRETARFPMRAEIELMLDGLNGWDSNHGIETPASVGISLEWSTSNSGNWYPIPIDFSGIERTINKGTKLSSVFEILTETAVNKIPITGFGKTINKIGKYGNRDFTGIQIVGGRVSKLWNIHILFNTVGGQVDLSADSKSDNTLPETIYFYSNSSTVLTRANAKQMRFLAEIDFLAEDVWSKDGRPVFIRATRTTKMYSGGYRDKVYLSAIRTQQYNPKESSENELVPAKNINDRLKDKFCRIGIKLKVNKNTQENLDRFNVIASMTGRTWNNGWSIEKTKTSNSAAVLLELITGLIHEPSKHKDDELDLDSFGKLYKYCEKRDVEIEDKGLKGFNLECNGALTSGVKKIDAINSVLATCDGGLYIDEFGKLEVYYDDYQATPIALLNPQRIIKMVDQRLLERKADGYNAEFIDEEAGWTQTTHKILRPNIKIDPGKNTYSPVKLDFTTGYYQAMWHARRMMAKETHRPGEIKVSVGKEGRYYKPGSLIKVQHERFKIGVGSGEITELIKDGNQVIGLKLMERFDIAADRDYWIEYYVVDSDRNHVVTKKIQSIKGYTDKLMFTTPINIDSPDVPVFGNILSTMYGEKTEIPKIWEAKRYIVSNLSENEDGYDLTLVEYADDIYKTGIIQERSSSILSPAPKEHLDQQIHELTEKVKELQEQTSPQNLSKIANDIADEKISFKTPAYRGITYNADHENTGIIEGNIMNIGDYIMYGGITEGIWVNARMYEWDGYKWTQLIIENNRWKYLDGINDLTEGALDGVFSNAFINTLIANTAIIDKLFSKAVTIHDPGLIQSENYKEDTSGFIVRSKAVNGIQSEFTDIKTKNMYATSGRFEKITGIDMSIQGGTINIGPLFVSNDKTTPSITKTYPTTTYLTEFVRNYTNNNENKTITMYYGGTLSSGNSIWNLYSFTISYRYYVSSAGGSNTDFPHYVSKIEFNTSGGVKEVSYDSDRGYTWGNARIGYQVVINGGGSGSTFKLTDIPTVDPHEKGKLYALKPDYKLYISLG